MTNLGVPNAQIHTKNKQITYDANTQMWKFSICGKTEKPQDYTNLERHVWWRNGVTRLDNLHKENAKQITLTEIQKNRLETLSLTPQNEENAQIQIQNNKTTDNEGQKETTQPNTQNPKPPTIWEQLEFITWKPTTEKWKCNIEQCNKEPINQTNLT